MTDPIKLSDYIPDRYIPLRFPAGKVVAAFFGLILLVALIRTVAFTVPAESEGVVLRFGRFIDTVPSGLHFKLPFGVDRVAIVPVKRQLKQEFGFTAHIRSRGEEAQAIKREAGFKARRWVVERVHSWMNRFRRILIRWDKNPDNYIAFLHFACALIAFRAAGLLG